jgi:hypothetical protein
MKGKLVKHSDTIIALVLDPSDTVATLLADVEKGGTVLLKGAAGVIAAREALPFGHKIAIREMKGNDPVLKYGQSIGIATTVIHTGDWVHVHNMSSTLDTDFRKRITV